MTDPRALQIRAMTGNDLKVLVVMFLLGAVNVGNKAIKSFCGLSYPTVASCLDNLAALGMVTQTHRTTGWQITEGGFQLLLPTDSSKDFFDSEAIINNGPLKDKEIKELNINNNSDLSKKTFDPAIVKALHTIGIYNPKAIELASLDHVTQEYIDSWGLALQFNKVGKGGSDVPLAIHLMGQKATAPEVSQEEQEAETCHVCGHSAIDHGGGNCWGKYSYTYGKRTKCAQCGEYPCTCCDICLETPCECDD